MRHLTISKTGLDYIQKSPLDYWFKFENPDREVYRDSNDSIMNKVLRCLLFTPALFAAKFITSPKYRYPTNIQKQELSDLRRQADAIGFNVINTEDKEITTLASQAIKNHRVSGKFISDAESDVSLDFIETESGVCIKTNLHAVVSKSVILHVSFVSDSSEDGFVKEVSRVKLHKKAALQIDAYESASGNDETDFVFILVEKTPPFKVGVYQIEQTAIDIGRQEYIQNCKTFAECTKSGVWPGNEEVVKTISLPDWALR